MKTRINKILDLFATFLAHHKGLLPIVGILFIVINAILQFTAMSNIVAETNLFLHVGIVVALIGFLLAWSL